METELPCPSFAEAPQLSCCLGSRGAAAPEPAGHGVRHCEERRCVRRSRSWLNAPAQAESLSGFKWRQVFAGHPESCSGVSSPSSSSVTSVSHRGAGVLKVTHTMTTACAVCSDFVFKCRCLWCREALLFLTASIAITSLPLLVGKMNFDQK